MSNEFGLDYKGWCRLTSPGEEFRGFYWGKSIISDKKKYPPGDG